MTSQRHKELGERSIDQPYHYDFSEWSCSVPSGQNRISYR